MAPPQTPKATPPRAGTSRLLAMKFMNRLQPSDSAPTTSSPLASAPSTPTFNKTDRASSSEDENGDEDGERPSAKRRKVSSAAGGPGTASPTTAAGSAVAGGSTVAEIEATMRAAMDEEERRRQVAIKRRAAELGDEHWTWNAPLPPHVAAKLAPNSASATARMPYAVVRVGFAEIDERTATDDGASHSPTTTSAPNSPALATSTSTKPTIMRFNMKKVC